MPRYLKPYTKERLTSTTYQWNNELEKVQTVAIYLLDSKSKTDCNNTMTSDELWQVYESEKNTTSHFVNIQRNTFIVYLSRLGSDPQSFIECLGKKKGYWFNKNRYLIATGQKMPSVTKTAESKLYPVVETWIGLCGYRYFGNISTKKRQGKWKNPDVIGIKITEILGEHHVEVATIEVKPTIKYWEKNIFEAVAHLMMSNRSYFAFLCTKEELNAEELQMREYANRFGVGLLAIFQDKNKEGDYYVELVSQAPLQTVNPAEQNNFLCANSIVMEGDLHKVLKQSKNI